MLHSKPTTCLFLIVLSATILIQTAAATTANFNVAAGKEETRTLNLAVDDHVVIHFSVVGGQSESMLDFHMMLPNGTVKNFGLVGSLSYRFVCDTDGDYLLHFSNVGLSEDKLVSLDYEVEHYVFGLPQMFFLTLVIVLFCVGAVAVFILLGKPR